MVPSEGVVFLPTVFEPVDALSYEENYFFHLALRVYGLPVAMFLVEKTSSAAQHMLWF